MQITADEISQDFSSAFFMVQFICKFFLANVTYCLQKTFETLRNELFSGMNVPMFLKLFIPIIRPLVIVV